MRMFDTSDFETPTFAAMALIVCPLACMVLIRSRSRMIRLLENMAARYEAGVETIGNALEAECYSETSSATVNSLCSISITSLN